MRFRQILRLIGILNLFLGLFMLAPLLVSLIYSDGSSLPILYSFAITSGGGLLLFLVDVRTGVISLWTEHRKAQNPHGQKRERGGKESISCTESRHIRTAR